ncbi:MAG: di-trans,poly-cis-decaprenylcistransferase [Clostridia bacterium]|nr:di-trans,poly-cis-decaprenylcistransferase [Clostridia bacterium]
MIKTYAQGFSYRNGSFIAADSTEGYKGTMAYSVISAHNQNAVTERGQTVNVKFDAIASHDITYVGIIQTAKAIGLEKFPIPYVLTNCHNSLCAVGGTINEDDHIFGLSAAKKYGGIFVPPHYAVIHTYMRENFAGCGKMILGSDSHTRYGALGTMAIGEGGPELVKQIIGKTYDVTYPEVVAINLVGAPRKGVGPQDVALAIIGKVFKNGFVKNKVMEFVGEGVKNLPIEYRIGIDVMTTETTCLSSIWITDDEVKNYLEARGRANDFKVMQPEDGAYYDALIEVDLSKVEPMIALPFHPSNVYTIRELLANPYEILSECEKKIDEYNMRICFLGDKTPFEPKRRARMERLEAKTREKTRILNIAFNYGGRDEIVRACHRLSAAGVKEADEQSFAAALDTACAGDPDLIVRTGGDLRISNFLLWQAAYAELYFTDVLWPDFGAAEIDKAVEAFYKRKRRFGGV